MISFATVNGTKITEDEEKNLIILEKVICQMSHPFLDFQQMVDCVFGTQERNKPGNSWALPKKDP